jgi:FkbM family methyltransferase
MNPRHWRHRLRETVGIIRSLRIYYGSRSRTRRMRAFYQQFVRPGDLVFDIGAHVGDRVAAFRHLGARVVAVEPQPAPFRWLKMRYGRDHAVTLHQVAVSDKSGPLTFHLNLSNPTISTASPEFIAATKGAPGWENQRWEETLSVRATTLDDIITRHGIPTFTKIDVEGFERHVLHGLSQPLPALSFEFTTIQRAIALDCLVRLTALGDYLFNVALGENQTMEFTHPVLHHEMAEFIRALPHEANSGDIYATRA